ncbi:TonB-dependent receptor domain-containing protein [Sediminitomix flava]|uniref:Fe(3+) dicitrate transport protein n=1 Tax=Sediminitomix flava TaxID=379075 RepID=A0A315Z873_SEDFL|nr:TonB-dependent receptor [Sediminitomix flava]PWJ39380.1 Fe(3+) dicitrate transport protein [Sediminitomix flava]
MSSFLRRFFQLGICTLLCFQLFSASAQDVRIYGYVKRHNSNEKIADAAVFVKGTSIKVITDKKGFFQLPSLPLGQTYIISVFKLGMQTSSKEVTPQTSKLKLDLTLQDFEELLEEVSVNGLDESSEIARLNEVEGTAIYAAKKSEVILLKNLTANLATNNSRQVYNKVPGLNIWESDGAGIQLGIGGRGLSPNRTSNFNTRQNGYDIAADALGYPESYYTPPLEAVERIQVVRGAASLQYGTQFGGMLNFRMKKGNSEKPFEIVSRQTVGSFGLFNSFNSVGGQTGKLNYYTAYQYKTGDGWRPNSEFDVNTLYSAFNYQFTEKFKVGLDFTHMDYLAKQPGGLTDIQFETDPRASTTDKNWFKVDWNILALNAEYRFSPRSRFEMRAFGLYAGRDALGINQRSEFPETDPRLLVSDKFRNIGTELRYIQHYDLLGKSSVFLVGTRLYRGFDLKQQGNASNGFDADFSFTDESSLLSDHDFYIHNYAGFIENIINLSDKFSITPGVRFEWIGTEGIGYFQEEKTIGVDDLGFPITGMVDVEDNISKYRPIFLAGIGLSYKPKEGMEVYANFSQNYRAITFSDLRVLNTNVRIDPDLQDERGYSADLGLRGRNDFLNYDLSAFYLKYNNKIGLAVPSNPIRTNIADAFTTGIEAFGELNALYFIDPQWESRLNIFANISFIHGQYISEENTYDGNMVELVPPFNLKTGFSFQKGGFAASWQYSFVDKQYTDAFNTEEPLADAVYGPIPSYQVMDLSLKYNYKWFTVESGVNNLTNEMYFTRRATGYPGPGIIPSDGRNYYLTLQVKL